MHKLNEILKENQNWNLGSIQVYVDNLHHPFFETPNQYVLPRLSIHGLDEYTAEQYLNEIKTFLPKEVREFSVLPLRIFKRESSKLILGLDLYFGTQKFIYLIKFECKHLGGVNNQDVIHPASQEYGPSCFTNKIYFTQGIFPIESIQKNGNEILAFQIIPFTKSIFQSNLEIYKKKFISELFDEVDYSHLIEEINQKIEFKKYWELGKIFQPLKIEHLSLSVQFLSWDISGNISEFKKFYLLISEILESKTNLETQRLAFWEWLKKHKAERSLTKSGNIAWKIFIT